MTAETEDATLWFMKRNARYVDEKPYLFTYAAENGEWPSNVEHAPQESIAIRNLRDYVPPFEESGIAVLQLPESSDVVDLYDNSEHVENILLPKVREIVKSWLKADTVHILEYKLRKRDPEFLKSHKMDYQTSQPVIGAHVDYTPVEIMRILQSVREGEMSAIRNKRIQALNVWSPLKGPLRDWPLCVCDSSTVAKDDLQTADVIFSDRVAENYQVHYSEGQKWYYLKDQMPNELLVFRATDTNRPTTAAVPHCSFQVSETSRSRLFRESIEIRVIVLQDH